MSWLATSLSITPSSRRAASREYSGSSEIRAAAVWMESRSSSLVVAPLNKPPMVLLATRIGSTLSSPAQQRSTARTILLTSAFSREPLRLRTCITEFFEGEGNDEAESANDVCTGAGAVAEAVAGGVTEAVAGAAIY